MSEDIACACPECACWYPATDDEPVCWACREGNHRAPLEL